MLYYVLIFLSLLSPFLYAQKRTPLYELKQGFGENEVHYFKRALEISGDDKEIERLYISFDVKNIFQTIRNQILTSHFSEKTLRAKCKNLGFTKLSSCYSYELMSLKTKYFGLTIPHLIVMFKNEAAFTWLLKIIERYSLQSVLDNQDKRGWTPSHFAALHKTDNFLKRLKEAGANQEIKNSFAGTANQVYQMTHISKLTHNTVNVWDENQSLVVPMKADEFFKETGTRFVERMKVSPYLMIIFWHEGDAYRLFDDFGNPSSSQWMPLIENSHGVYTDLYVKKLTSHDTGTEHDIGYGLFALKDIPEGKIITDYQGIFVLDVSDKLDNEHSTDDVDGTEVRGYAAFANDCTPNAYLDRVANAHGFPGLRVLVSLLPIEKDDMICFNYLTHSIKKGAYVELAKERMNNFIKHYGSLSEAFKVIHPKTQKNSQSDSSYLSKDALELFYVYENLLYMLGTNSVLIRLVLEGYLTKDDLVSARGHENKMRDFVSTLNKYYGHTSFYSNFGECLINLSDILTKIPKDNKDVLREFIVKEKSQESAILKSSFLCVLSNQFERKLSSQGLLKDHLEQLWFNEWKYFCENHKNAFKDDLLNCDRLNKILVSFKEEL